MIRAAARAVVLVVATLLSLRCCSSSSEEEHDDVYVVRSAADALVVGLAASAEGAVVRASWFGPVVLHDPIKVRGGGNAGCLGSGGDNGAQTAAKTVFF